MPLYGRSRYPSVPVRFIGVLALLVAAAGDCLADTPDFRDVYPLLETHCGICHVQGGADGPWSLNTPPGPERFPECLTRGEAEQLRCATYHQLVDAPAPGIPAWIRPGDGAASEPYAQACDVEVSFHIGHSIPAPLPAEGCDLFLRWIESGAAER